MLGWIQLNINPKFFSYVEYNSASILSFFGRIQLDTLTMHSTLEITNIAHILAKFESRYCGVGLELLTWMAPQSSSCLQGCNWDCSFSDDCLHKYVNSILLSLHMLPSSMELHIFTITMQLSLSWVNALPSYLHENPCFLKIHLSHICSHYCENTP